MVDATRDRSLDLVNVPRTLTYAVRPAVVARYFGNLCGGLALLSVLPVAVAAVTGEWLMLAALGAMVVATGVGGWLLSRLRTTEEVQPNEAMVVVGLMFLAAPLIGTLPLSVTGLAPLDALFESISGITTTGLTVLADPDSASPAVLFLRSWMQWLGGLGFVVLSAALFLRPGTAAVRLAAAHAEEKDPVSGTRSHARKIVALYGVLTGIAAIGLALGGTPPFEAVLYAMSAVSTGGFTPSTAGTAGLSVPSIVILVLAFTVAATPLTLYRPGGGSGVRPWNDLQVRTLVVLGLLLTGGLLLTATSADGGSYAERVGGTLALAFSAQTTTGFAPAAIPEIAPAGKLLLCVGMLIGGAVGSTAGGIKLIRLLISLAVLRAAVARTALTPHAVYHPTLGGARLDVDEVQEVLLIVLLFVIVVAGSWVAFLAGGYSPLDSFFEVVSATGTVGLSTGITGSELSSGLKLVLCADMILGRLEVFVILIMLFPRTWIGNRRSAT